MATTLNLPVPDATPASLELQTVAGPWVDAVALGRAPLAQLSAGATVNDFVRVETAANSAGNTGIVPLSIPLVATTPVVVDTPISWARAVRVIPAGSSAQTSSLVVHLHSTNGAASPEPSTVTLRVPDAPPAAAVLRTLAGPWVDATGLGLVPLAQLSNIATENDFVRIETSPDNGSSAGIVASSTPLVATTPIVVDAPISFVRAVRIIPVGSSPQTRDLDVVLRSTNMA